MTVVCDYSSSRPSLPALKAAGISGVIRYCTRFGLSAGEVQAALAAGLTVTLVMETGSQPDLGGLAAGAADARAANASADAVGYAKNCWIYYVAEDPNRLPQQDWPTVDAYFAGVASVGGRPVGAYGGLQLVQHLLDVRLATRGWVVRPWGGVNANVHLAQEVTGVPAQFAGQIDIDTVLQADYGQMPRPNRLFSTAQEAGMLAWCLGLDGIRKDAVWVNADNSVSHGFSLTGNLMAMATENLGGGAVAVSSCAWDASGNFTLTVIGIDGVTPYIRVSNGSAWTVGWTPLPFKVHPPIPGPAGPPGAPGKAGPPGPPGPAYDDTAIKAEIADVVAKETQVAKDLTS